jgi:hypothetical protein
LKEILRDIGIVEKNIRSYKRIINDNITIKEYLENITNVKATAAKYKIRMKSFAQFVGEKLVFLLTAY